ncbi:putative peroxidase 18 [Iris pallida]|uniref:Peroxidase 18 n=1 Tax=Iris pallida TaxID=29817 RepID=A0AAX6E0T8_IRIPA|nr:putative peroxidase 18 [Iris pallida]
MAGEEDGTGRSGRHSRLQGSAAGGGEGRARRRGWQRTEWDLGGSRWARRDGRRGLRARRISREREAVPAARFVEGVQAGCNNERGIAHRRCHTPRWQY